MRRHSLAKRPWVRLGATLSAAILVGVCTPGAVRADGDEDGGGGGGGSSSASAEIANAWFNEIYALVRDTAGYSPPVASRAYGYCGVTLYEALVHGMKANGRVSNSPSKPSLSHYNSLAGQLNDLDELPAPSRSKRYHWPTVANAAMQTIATHFFPLSTSAIDDLAEGFFDEFAEDISDSVFDRSVEFGIDLAEAIIDWAGDDGFADIAAANAAFVPPAVDGPWVGLGTGLMPAWGGLRPFAVESSTQCTPQDHPEYSEDTGSEFYAHGLVVYNSTGDAGAKLSEDQKDIAYFWGDGPVQTGTPPGHWVSIMGLISEQKDLNLGTTAEGYARIGLSVADAFITCWQTKFTTYLLRPITYINNEIDADWTPLLTTPNFPTYTSGHSTQSGATQAILTDLLGKVSFTDTTHVDRGNTAVLADLVNDTRSFDSLFQAAKEAVISRLYGGIHYIFDNEFGFEQGVCVGETILDRVDFAK